MLENNFPHRGWARLHVLTTSLRCLVVDPFTKPKGKCFCRGPHHYQPRSRTGRGSQAEPNTIDRQLSKPAVPVHSTNADGVPEVGVRSPLAPGDQGSESDWVGKGRKKAHAGYRLLAAIDNYCM